jgi:hypothetical protein
MTEVLVVAVSGHIPAMVTGTYLQQIHRKVMTEEMRTMRILKLGVVAGAQVVLVEIVEMLAELGV